MIVPAARFTRETTTRWSHYEEGGMHALVLIFSDGSPETKATILPEDAPPIRDDQVWLKAWGENEGVPAALVAAGVVTLSGDFCSCGYEVALLATLTPAALEEIAKRGPEALAAQAAARARA